MWQVSITGIAAPEAAVLELLERRFQVSAASYQDAASGRQTFSVYPATLRATPVQARLWLRRGLEDICARQFRIVIKKLPRENWAESWKRHFKAMEIGGALLIKPGWSRRRARPGQRVVWLDPGLSFGTGHHATTAFCLRQLAACRRRGQSQSFLDLGTGSGILAIAAAKLGYSPIQALDFDPQSIVVSRANARRNRVGDRVRPQLRDVTRLPLRSARRWDVICANLTSDLLGSQAEKIAAWLEADGQLVVAGILRTEFCQIRDKLATFGLTLAENELKEEWHSGRFGGPVCLGK
jgi:ribosomal protein L11 methyltransferase